MKLSIAFLGFLATQSLCTPVEDATRAAIKAECGDLGVMKWDTKTLPKTMKATALRKCEQHPSELGISSPMMDPDAKPEDLDSSYGRNETTGTSPKEETGLDKRYSCNTGGRGWGFDYDYGCDNGWCWRNCDVNVGSPGGLEGKTKPWCWLAYKGGYGDWTPCGGWYDCKWSYDNRDADAKCGKGNCGACGCGC